MTAAPQGLRADAQERYRQVRARSLKLASGLSAEDQALQSMPDASPVKWHLAHTTWFFETFFLRERRDYRLFDPRFGYLFNSYYNAEGARQPRPERGLLSRPGLDDVHAYRAHVDAAMEQMLDSADERLLALGLAHEEQHQELMLMDIKHLFFCNPLGPAYAPRPEPPPRRDPAETGADAWIRFAPGLAEIGHDGRGFAFDNEGPRHRVYLEPFALCARLVTAGEYLAFIDDGGYARPELWLSDGWDTLCTQGWQAPLYWRRDSDGWRQFTLSGWRSLDPHEPLRHVSYYEADAFARWAGKRLPTEAEWEVAAACAGTLRQMFETAWQWTQSSYSAYPRYRAAAGSLGEYNGKFMCNQMVLRGGSQATAPGHTRISYRNFFPPQARWAFSGVRMAQDA